MVDLFFDKITTSWGEDFLIVYERFGIGKPLVIINKYQMEQLIKAWNIETNSAPNSPQTEINSCPNEKRDSMAKAKPPICQCESGAEDSFHKENAPNHSQQINIPPTNTTRVKQNNNNGMVDKLSLSADTNIHTQINKEIEKNCEQEAKC